MKEHPTNWPQEHRRAEGYITDKPPLDIADSVLGNPWVTALLGVSPSKKAVPLPALPYLQVPEAFLYIFIVGFYFYFPNDL